MSAEMRPSTTTVPAVRLGDARDELEQRALARAVPADDREGGARRTLNVTPDSAGNLSSGFSD